MKRITILWVCLIVWAWTSSYAASSWKWMNPLHATYSVIQNQAFQTEMKNCYVRLPDRAQQIVPTAVWDLSRQSAGLAIHFYSNTPQLRVRYQVAGSYFMPHMPATGVSGVDLYQIDPEGKKSFCFGNYSWGDTIQYTYHLTRKNPYHHHGFEYHLFLPLYNQIKWLEIGIPEESELKWIPASEEKPIVIYGTSIVQGACASRPGMAWTNILQRELDYPVINLGFSGSGKMEKEMIELINEVDARTYILDCLPNLTEKSEEEIYTLIMNAVLKLRASHPVPIILVEHAGYSNAETDSLQLKRYQQANRASRQAYMTLLQKQVPELYYLSNEELAFSADAWVDYVHPSDLGMQRQANVLLDCIRKALNIPVGTLTTTIPVTQRREPDSYEWLDRYRETLQLIQGQSPRAVILGNSIVHFWGGEPLAHRKSGAMSWEKFMRSAGFLNLGCGFDRIENVLWRVYHGELDGYQAEQVILMIGTNNLALNNDEEIVEGLDLLLQAIRDRQPKAKLKIVGILPRRDMEERVKQLNIRIHKMALRNHVTYTDVSSFLIQEDGKIDESLFLDGLHPNEKGYGKIAQEIIQ